MEKEYFRVIISATSEPEARSILSELLKRRLVAGGLIVGGPALYWWKGRIEDEPYFDITAYTLLGHRDEIIRVVEGMHKDEVPIISFFKIDYGNEKFLTWIEEWCSIK